MTRRRSAVLVSVVLLACSVGVWAQASPANAQLPVVACDAAIVPVPLGETLLLTEDCVTDHTYQVGPGKTLDGNGHTMYAVDPVGGHFLGAVVQNATAPSEIHVTNLTIRGQFTTGAVCDGGLARLRGILFSGASGTITNNRLIEILQPVSAQGCQEGNAIEARNFVPDDDPTTVDETLFSRDRTTVTISDNVVERYQKTGILANGNVDAIVTRNAIQGIGPSTVIAQNGVQIGFGATGLVSANVISGNNYTPTSFFSCGIIVVDADGVDRKQQDNLFPPNTDAMANEKDTCGFAKGGNYEPFGR
jgi:hypothetical protein